MGEQASTMAQCRLSLLILLVSLVQISQSRKTAETGGGAGGEGGGTCQEVYITIYQQGVTDKIGLDYGQAEDDGVTMISSLLAGYGCTNATAEGHEPYFENTCDDDDDYDTCAKVETSWDCRILPTAWAAFSAGAFTLNSPVGDDCAPEPKCGGPVGAQTCSYTPLPSASVFPTALNIVVNGDRCTACGMKEDYCPKYYDVHSCSIEWDYVTTQPTETTIFEIKYTVNAATSVRWTAQAAVLTLLVLAMRMFE